MQIKTKITQVNKKFFKISDEVNERNSVATTEKTVLRLYGLGNVWNNFLRARKCKD